VKLQPKNVEKPFQKLRKQLSKFPSKPAPEEVHSLRTQTRRLEATVAALVIDREKPSRRLLKAITPVRKAAGKVRDMDVLIGDALTLSGHQGSEALVRLIEQLAKMRVKSARKLRTVVRAQQQDARRLLKESSKLIRKKLKNDATGTDGEAAPGILITELSHWPPLDADNLHLFRIRIKELRYMLQLSAQTDERLVDVLGEVKDSIGEWHDWVELLKIAQKVLDPHSDRELLKHIEKTGAEKLERALKIANQARERYFSASDARKTSQKILQMAS
jgi:CHAD domain-containing protein